MIRYLKKFFETNKPLLGRWQVKHCHEILTVYNSIYQNRDHCGDTLCKKPVKAEEYVDTHKKTSTH